MLRFKDFEALGLSTVAISDKSDGDCARAAGADARRRVCETSGVAPASLVFLSQVHGTRASRVTAENCKHLIGSEGDALVTNARDVALGVFVADCVPVFLFDPVQRAAGLVHAGREGTRAEVVRSTVERMEAEFGSAPSDLHALIGPSAGPCCYEVSESMADQWRGGGLPVADRMLDLWEANAAQLRNSGVAAARIVCSKLCTICDGRFYSYRGGSRRQRNLAFLSL